MNVKGFFDSFATLFSTGLVPPDSPIRAIIIRWECLRLVYNGVLIVFTLLFLAAAGNPYLNPVELVAIVCFGAVAANVCYTLGPLAEIYVGVLGLKSEGITAIGFLAGTAFAVLMTLATLSVAVLQPPTGGEGWM